MNQKNNQFIWISPMRTIPAFLSNLITGKTNLFLFTISFALFISYVIIRKIVLESIIALYKDEELAVHEGKEYPNLRSKRQSIFSRSQK